jgi:hypothetical protein
MWRNLELFVIGGVYVVATVLYKGLNSAVRVLYQ